MKQLQDLTEALKSQGSEGSIGQLSRAFELFSTETKRLESAYRSLQEQAREINAELERKIRELDASTEYLNSILSHIRQGLIFVSNHGVISTYNQAAEGILGVPAEKVLLRPFSEMFEDDSFGFSLKEAVCDQRVPELLTLFYTRTQRHLEIQVSLVSPLENLLGGVIILIRDVTELQKLRNLAERNDRLKELGEMAASVAHEIRNPLGGIEGFASLLIRDLQEHPKMQGMAKQIADGAQIINRLITNVLNYARPIRLQVESCDLRVLCEEALAIVSTQYPHKVTFCGNSTEAVVDYKLVKNALLNLLVNAIQASKEESPVTVHLDSVEDQAILQVRDLGKGIPQENLEKIFCPFFTTKHDGNGFGLAEVYKTLQAHGGSVDVASIENEGSTFILRFPLHAKRGSRDAD